MRLASASSAIRSVRFSGTIPPVVALFGRWPEYPLRHQVAHIKSADGAMKAFQVEIADRLGTGDRFDGELDPAVDQNLAVGGLRAEAGAEIDHPARPRIGKTARL